MGFRKNLEDRVQFLESSLRKDFILYGPNDLDRVRSIESRLDSHFRAIHEHTDSIAKVWDGMQEVDNKLDHEKTRSDQLFPALERRIDQLQKRLDLVANHAHLAGRKVVGVTREPFGADGITVVGTCVIRPEGVSVVDRDGIEWVCSTVRSYDEVKEEVEAANE